MESRKELQKPEAQREPEHKWNGGQQQQKRWAQHGTQEMPQGKQYNELPD